MTAVTDSANSSRQMAAEQLRTIAWASLLGVVSGLACVAVRCFMQALQWVFTQQAGSLPHAAATLSDERRLLTPVLGAALAAAVAWGAERWLRGRPFEEYVDAVRLQDGAIAFAPTLWRTLSGALSVATGAAIGREGAMIQFAAAVTSWCGRHHGARAPSLGRQVSYGAAAAIAAAYSAPCAGVFFACEVVLGEWSWLDAAPLAAASTAGWAVSRVLLAGGPLLAAHGVSMTAVLALKGVVVAILMGGLAPAYHRLLHRARHIARWPLALLWAGLAVGLLSLRQPAVWGNGDAALRTVLDGTHPWATVLELLVLRLAATGICVGAGTVGGVFTPTLFAGAAMGLLCGVALGSSPAALFAIVGMAAFLSAVTHAPAMATLMTVELTGSWHLLPLLFLYNLLAWHISRRLSSDSLYAIATPDPLESESHCMTVPA